MFPAAKPIGRKTAPYPMNEFRGLRGGVRSSPPGGAARGPQRRDPPRRRLAAPTSRTHVHADARTWRRRSVQAGPGGNDEVRPAPERFPWTAFARAFGLPHCTTSLGKVRDDRKDSDGSPDPHQRGHRPGDRSAPRPGRDRRRDARRRGHDPLHCALPERSDRRARRHAAACPGGPPLLHASARRAARRDPQIDRGAGKAHAKAREGNRDGGNEVAARGHLPPLQAPPAHEGDDRPGEGTRTTRRPDHDRSERGSGSPRPVLCRQGRPGCARSARRCPRHPCRGSLRDGRSAGRPAQLPQEGGRGHGEGREGQGGGGRQVLRLFRPDRVPGPECPRTAPWP